MNLVKIFVSVLVVMAIVLGAAFILPWERVEWGKLTMTPAQTITVTGVADSQERPQIARFTAGANAVSSNKQEAIDRVNQQVQQTIERVKEFGIAQEDIKTQNLSVYQEQESYYEEGVQRTRPGQWRVDNTIEITLRDVSRASDLVAVLNQGELTNVYGPNFMLDDTAYADTELLKQAVEDARAKADLLAEASGRRVSKVLSITEGGAGSPVYPMFARETGGGGGMPIEPGTQQISRSVTVVFEVE